MSPVRLAVFDCDGTLADGQASACAAIVRAFAGLGLPAPVDADIRRSLGLDLLQTVRRLLPGHDDALHRAATAACHDAARDLRRAGGTGEPLFPGIRALLEALRARGWLLGIATGNSARGLDRCLSASGLDGMFRTLQTADRHPGKPHPAMLLAALDAAPASPDHAVMIGDTVHDMQMARTAGVRALGVAWGHHPARELVAAGAEAVAQTPQDLDRWLS